MKTEIQLIARFHNGQSYVYYGKTKKECKDQLIKRFGDTKGFTSLKFSKIDQKTK